MTHMGQLFVDRRHDHSGALVFKLSGDLHGSEQAYEFQEQVREAINGGNDRLVIDLSGIKRIDSSGIGILTALIVSARNGDARIVFSALPQRVDRLLAIVWPLELVDRAATLEEAIAKLS